MPRVWEEIEGKRAQWGAEHVADCIRRGMAGQPGWFYAFERGHVVGTPFSNDLELCALVGFAAAVGGRFVLVMRPPVGQVEGGSNAA
jgi:hypothetical protein